MLNKTRCTVDAEVSGAQRNKGNPFDPRNKLVMVGLKDEDGLSPFIVDTEDRPYGAEIRRITARLVRAEIVVGFNLKFDLHWLRRYGVPMPRLVWDCQLGEFLLSNQSKQYPSLNDALARYKIPPKLDVVATEYWDKGIDTDQVPLDILTEYQLDDVEKTDMLFELQYNDLAKQGKLRLMELCCADLLVLEEMEYNGLVVDVAFSSQEATRLEGEQVGLEKRLAELSGEPNLNWSSPKQVSALLYGGIVKETGSEVVGVFKTGARAGQPKTRKIVVERLLPRLVDPLPNSELADIGYFSTDESTLKQLEADGKGRELIDTYLRYKEIDKLVGTYYRGLLKRINDMGWEDETIHHNLNQCVVVTGRLSSSQPNLQNIERGVKEIFISRFL